MTPLTHNLTGAALGLGASALFSPSVAGIFFVGCLFGARAPDWLEVARFNRRTGQRESLIPHRTLTHWPWIWAGLLALSLNSYHQGGVNAQSSLALAGFAASSLFHIALDAMTVMGVPVGLNPFGRRKSLRLLKTGSSREVLVILTAFVLAGMSWSFRP